MNSILKFLKPSGLHHGLPALIITWIIALLVSPIAGIVFAILVIGFYGGRELKEAESRGFNLFKISTWTKDAFERWDYTTPWILSTISIVVLSLML